MAVGNVSVLKALLQRKTTTARQVGENFSGGLRASVALNEQAIAQAAADRGVAAPVLSGDQVDRMDLAAIQRYGDRMKSPDFGKQQRVEALGNAYGAVVGSLRASAIMAAADVALLTVGGPLGVAVLALAVPIQAIVSAVQIHSALKELHGVPIKDLNGQLGREVASLQTDRAALAQDPARRAERDRTLDQRIALLDEARKTNPGATVDDLFKA